MRLWCSPVSSVCDQYYFESAWRIWNLRLNRRMLCHHVIEKLYKYKVIHHCLNNYNPCMTAYYKYMNYKYFWFTTYNDFRLNVTDRYTRPWVSIRSRMWRVFGTDCLDVILLTLRYPATIGYSYAYSQLGSCESHNTYLITKYVAFIKSYLTIMRIIMSRIVTAIQSY